MEFSGTVLRDARRVRAWSQGDLAREAGVSARSISLLESGQQQPRPSTLRRLSKALGVQPAHFFIVTGPGQGKTQAMLDALAAFTPEPEADPEKAAA